MTKYIIKRILEAIPTLLGVSILSFILMHIVPGDPVRLMLGRYWTPERAAELSKNLGLNHPLWEQYLIWLRNMCEGNLGYSYTYSKPVTTEILMNLPHTLILVGCAMVIAVLLAVFIGSLQAYFENSVGDHIATFLGYFFYAMPVFWLAMLLISFFSLDIRLFPSGGIMSPQESGFNLWDYINHLILPVITLVVIQLAGWSRYMRSSMRDTLLQDYIRTARAKGLREFGVIFVHALRNSILPIITLLGLQLPGLFGGAVIVEEVFNYPGMGLLYWNGLQVLDFPILLGIIMFLGVITVLGNLLADLAYAIVDPRISYD
ncbi:ABC transporter permease [Alicyclobacillus cycloheptanicus]|uniref:Peptide/nickel transport system permease protein n=1 Tax=Alicyclobacillus cycloheptanicus TaxID=1457 RepID=A0ABT9XFT7_9BACL|nr:ABC transporter permease [Alicyclobacillus cycloheptanicus]MDQ0189162.1 peptide/nickel transport system permease protein [Alicyclobacillus cycloheptanicus]WDM00353.1 ABC transporter permease [Alicyclobacillus cycloheptanicus]